MRANINQLTARQRRALYDEVNKQTARNVQNLSQNLCAMVLWCLHIHPSTRWGKKRLLRFQKDFLPMIEELQQYYLAENAEETAFALKYRLKHEVGIDVDELDEMFSVKVKMEK